MTHADLCATVDGLARDTDFSGVVSVRVGNEVAFEAAYGFADREHQRVSTPETRFGLASGTKGFTALTVMRLIEDQALEPTTTARSVLGTDLPLIDAAVTVEQLLAHRSGIGDYLDEDLIADIEQWPFSVRAQDIARTADCLPLLDGHPQKSPPDQRFSYCNGGYVVLALLCERVTGIDFPDLVQAQVTTRANHTLTLYGLGRTDEALALAEDVVQRAQEAGVRTAEATAMETVARCMSSRGESTAAAEAAERAAQLFADVDNLLDARDLWQLAAEAWADAGDTDRADAARRAAANASTTAPAS